MAALMGKWYHEDLGHGAVHSMRFGDILYTATTPFQNVEVVQTEAFGYALMLDGVLNSAEKVRPTVASPTSLIQRPVISYHVAG